MARRAHRHGDRAAADPDLERLLDRDAVALAPAVRQPDDVDRRGGVRRSLHGDEAYASGSPESVMSASATERLDDEIVEDRAIAVDRGGDVARRELVGAALVRLLDLARGEELGDDLALLALADDRIVDVVARLLEHPRDEIVELGERARRVVVEVRPRSRPSRSPTRAC